MSELDEEVAHVLLDSFTELLIFAFLEPVFDDLLELIEIQRLADADKVDEYFHRLVCEGILNLLVLIVGLGLL